RGAAARGLSHGAGSPWRDRFARVQRSGRRGPFEGAVCRRSGGTFEPAAARLAGAVFRFEPRAEVGSRRGRDRAVEGKPCRSAPAGCGDQAVKPLDLLTEPASPVAMTERRWDSEQDPYVLLDYLFPMRSLDSAEQQTRQSRLYLIACA